MHGYKILPDPLPALVAGYRSQRIASSFGEIRSYEEYVRYFPIISYRKIADDPAAYFPNDLKMFLRTRGFTGPPKQIPYSEAMLEEVAQPLGDWMRRWLSPGKVALSLVSLAPEEVATPEGTIPSFTALAKQLEATGLVILPPETPTQDASFLALSKLIIPRAEALVGPAAQVVAFLRSIVSQGKVDLLKPLRYSFLTGMAEIGRLFAPEARRLVPHLQVLEFYSAAEGLFAFQPFQSIHGGAEGGLSFQGSASFFEIETGKGVHPVVNARRGETGSLIVSTPVFPRYRIGDFLLHLGEGNWRVLGKDGRTTRLGYYLKHMFPG
ncbi:MAG: hypothetical protein NTV14_03525 [Coprothermobacterota bacterium]|nr:hypothetical protein [Coprothermobacterota bacterium]